MPTRRQPIPESWASYERGGRLGSTNSQLSHNQIQFDEESQQHHSHHPSSDEDGLLHPGGAYEQHHGDSGLRHRRSSISMRIQSIRNAGGVNSIDNFARSWQRAAAFPQITPIRPSFRLADGEEFEEHDGGARDEHTGPRDPRSLLREAFAQQGRKPSDSAMMDESGVTTPTLPQGSRGDSVAGMDREPLLRQRIASLHDNSIFTVEPVSASHIGTSYGTWGSLSSNVNEPAMRHAGRLFREHQLSRSADADQDNEPLLVKTVKDENGHSIQVIVGQSTLPQTIFNSINVLVGVGLLALPLALQYSGLIPGLVFFMFAAASTMYTAKLLAKCLDVDSSLVTFADLAYISYGSWARVATSVLFSLELLATCVALVVLFADSLDALTNGSWGLTEWKVVCGIILIPLTFVPLRYLSITSVLGIISCFAIVLAIFVDGLIKPDQPGSLRSPAKIHLFPDNWFTFPVSMGLLMSPWGGHSVFPNIYRDMRHAEKYRRGLSITYTFTFLLDAFMAIVGLLMFGDTVKDEVTRNIITTKGYPEWLNYVLTACVAIIPLTKIPLNARPIVSTIEHFLSLDDRSIVLPSESTTGMSAFSRGVLKATVRITCVVAFVILAVLVPEFDRIMSLLGAVACFTICIILPAAFHLKLFGSQLGRWEKMRDWSLIIVSSVLAIVSTAFNFMPKDLLEHA